MTESGSAVSDPVYLGVWTNWSLGGRITGSIITLTRRDSGFLTAFLALFVTFTGSRLWRICCFILHQIFLSKNKPQDGLYHQRQAIFRNATDGTSGSIGFIKILRAWYRRADRPLYRILPTIIFSICMTAALAVASLFSSRIVSNIGNEVLISSPRCGVAVPPANRTQPTVEQTIQVYDPWLTQCIISYANYVQRCYTERSRPNDCKHFVKKSLPSTVDRNADCPFRGNICRHQRGNIKVDTGYLSSQADLGVNGPIQSQFDIRMINHCAPPNTTKYQEIVYYSENKPYMRYVLGAQINGPRYTYEVGQLSPEELSWQQTSSSLPEYGINSHKCAVHNGSQDLKTSSFLPIPELALSDGDTTLFFLSTDGIYYSAPVDDDWYAAHRKVNQELLFDDATPVYVADEPASVLGCKSSYQICDPALTPERGCTPWGGIRDAGLTYKQLENRRDRVIYWVVALQPIDLVVRVLRASSLTSNFRFPDHVQSSLPMNQWQMEVEYWHNFVLAQLQGRRVDWSSGPGDSGILDLFWTRPDNEDYEFLCKNQDHVPNEVFLSLTHIQKIISSDYANFSVLWLFIVFVAGLVVILFEFFLEPISAFLERRGITGLSSLEWYSNDTLQLQRMAHEELGLGGTWEGCTGAHAVPITQKGELLAVLDVSDISHPRLTNAFKQADDEQDDNSDGEEDCVSQSRCWESTSTGICSKCGGRIKIDAPNNGEQGDCSSQAESQIRQDTRACIEASTTDSVS